MPNDTPTARPLVVAALDDNRPPSERYRRLHDLAVTAQQQRWVFEHVDVVGSEVVIRIPAGIVDAFRDYVELACRHLPAVLDELLVAQGIVELQLLDDFLAAHTIRRAPDAKGCEPWPLREFMRVLYGWAHDSRAAVICRDVATWRGRLEQRGFQVSCDDRGAVILGLQLRKDWRLG